METTTTPQQQTTDQEVALIEAWIPEVRKAGGVLQKHKLRTAGAEKRGQAILKMLEESGGVMTQEIDAKCQKFLADCSAAKTEMELARKPITTLGQQITGMYTREEKKLDAKEGAIPKQIQALRDGYVKQLKEADQKRQKEAQEKLAKEQEVIELNAMVDRGIGEILALQMKKKKASATDSFNKITLADWESKKKGLEGWIPSLGDKEIELMKAETIAWMVTNWGTRPLLHTNEETAKIIDARIKQFNWQGQKPLFINELSELRQSLLDRMDSKKKELQDIAAAQDANEKIRLQNQQAQREQEEKDRLEREQKEKAEKARQQSESTADGAKALALFNQAVETAPTAPLPKARSGYKITVKHQAGWVLIFQFWYQREGIKCAPVDMGKVKLDQMKTFAEKQMKEKQEKIESEHIVYEETDKAINERERKK